MLQAVPDKMTGCDVVVAVAVVADVADAAAVVDDMTVWVLGLQP